MQSPENNYSGDLYPVLKEPRLHNSRLIDARNFNITLKQWKMLHAVVDCGGFSDAAEYLHISQSAISYTIARLQEQLGIAVLKLEGRKAQLTEAGRALLERSRHLIKDAAELELFAEKLKQGWQSEVRLAITQDFPTGLLMTAMRRYSQLGIDMRVSLMEAGMLEAEKALFERVADLAISAYVPSGFQGSPLIELEYVAVAHPHNPLFKLGREIMQTDLGRHIQIVIASTKQDQYKGKSQPIGLSQQWQVSSFDTAVGALCEGVGYGWLPRHRVEKWLNKGGLAILPLQHGSTYRACLYLIYGRSMTPGSSLSTFAELLQSIAANKPENAFPLSVLA
jgi:DNA-binding transcriptional LysR family regulator